MRPIPAPDSYALADGAHADDPHGKLRDVGQRQSVTTSSTDKFTDANHAASITRLADNEPTGELSVCIVSVFTAFCRP
jgi:hypothetical protein